MKSLKSLSRIKRFKMEQIWSNSWKKKLIEPENLEKKVELLRKSSHSIVTINGSFDLLHAGHLHILFEASKQGDQLIVLLNSDESIKLYKSPTRPLISLPFRLQMMAAIEFVDWVSFFHETTPCGVLKKIRPNVHVNGAEYTLNCVESETVVEGGGKIHLVERIEGLSTSQIIEKIGTICDS